MATIKSRTSNFRKEIPLRLFNHIIGIRDSIHQKKPEFNYLESHSVEKFIFSFDELNLPILLELKKQNKFTPEIKDFLSTHSNADISWVKAFPDIVWNFNELSSSVKFDISWVEAYPEVVWNWPNICLSKNLSLEWLKKHPEYPWNWEIISSHKNFEFEWIEFIIGKGNQNRIWNALSDRKNLKLGWIISYLDQPWNWEYLSENENVTLAWLECLPLQPWNFEILSSHPNFSLEWIEAFPNENWNLVDIIGDKKIFLDFLEIEATQYMAIYKIKKWWKKIIYDPEHLVGIRFIGKMYDKNFPN